MRRFHVVALIATVACLAMAEPAANAAAPPASSATSSNRRCAGRADSDRLETNRGSLPKRVCTATNVASGSAQGDPGATASGSGLREALDCWCGLDAEGRDFCFEHMYCNEVRACTSSAECAPGWRCLAHNCCLPPKDFACFPECSLVCIDGGICGSYEQCEIPPANDECPNAESLTVPAEVIAWTTAADYDDAPYCDTANTARGIWYGVVGTGHTITASTCTEFVDFDTKISVYCAGCDHLLCVAGNDDNCEEAPGTQSTVSWCSEAGEEYLILVHGYEDERGGCVLNVWDDGASCDDPPNCVPCDITCDPAGTPEDEPRCGIPEDTMNGGCNSDPPVFMPIACGQTYCGTAGYDGSTRDTDWYEIAVTGYTAFTWTVVAEFPVLTGIAATDPYGSGDCADSVGYVDPFVIAEPCENVTMTLCLAPGVYWFFVAPTFDRVFDCGAEYEATLTCGPCAAAACCLPGGVCVDLPPEDCVAQGGEPQGEGTECTGLQGCCFPDGVCKDLDPLCCRDAGGEPQGPDTGCVDMTIACCLRDGSGGCVNVDPLCCDEMGGFFSPWGELVCLGDLDGDGFDDACDPGWQPEDPHKMHYPQLPDPGGWDVHATAPLVLADDWKCTEAGWVTDIHFWGSWMGGLEGQLVGFVLSIHKDIPADPPQVPYSRPGELLWEREIFDFVAVPIDPPTTQGWYDPGSGEVMFDDHRAFFQYNIYLFAQNDWFWQDEGTIYWLSVSAIVQDADQTRWGWKSSQDHWNDDAAWAYLGDLAWIDLWEPPQFERSLDLAFVITGGLESTGACCYEVSASGAMGCTETSPYWCQYEFQGIYEGDGTVCEGMEACCLEVSPAMEDCVDADALCCRNHLGGIPQGPGTACAPAEACCLNTGDCVMADPLCCENLLDGKSQGPNTVCTQREGCCLDDGTCLDIDPLCCDDFGGTPQGQDTGCVDMTIACCLQDGSGDCVDVDPLCCDDVGGIPSSAGEPACLGDLDGDGVDEACKSWHPGDPHKMHHPQLPDESGWDVSATQPLVLADDWKCRETGWVKDIHFWGSWAEAVEGRILGFVLSIHEDIPAEQSPTGYSMPGATLWEREVDKFGVVPIDPPTMQGWYNPGSGVFRFDDHQAFYQYNVYLSEEDWFWQEEGTIYWLNISAVVQDVERTRWGWKSSTDHWNDDAVWAFRDELYWIDLWEPPEFERSLDLAFVITGGGDVIGACCYGMAAADPRLCVETTEERCVRELGGVYEGDGTVCEGMEACCLTLGPVAEDCVNADALCCRNELGGIPQGPGTTCTEDEACCLQDGDCVMADPLCCASEWGGMPQGEGSTCSDIIIACCLQDGSGGCLDVDPLCCDDIGGIPSTIGAPFCMGDGNDNGVDDACEGPWVEQACCLPDGHCIDTDHMDCIALEGDPQGPGTNCETTICRPLKWSQPPTVNADSPHPQCFWGWDEPSMYGSPQIVADDWACRSTRPVTDIHWWGSYVGWRYPEPPETAPDRFHIGIWTDVPAGGDPPWSHPDVMIWEWVVPREALREQPVGCDFHPSHDLEDTCFRYDFMIPQDQWFHQGPSCEIFWISIAAVYVDEPGQHVWGWKTRRPHRHDDALRIFAPTNPIPGSVFQQGEPIHGPADVSWDMAFVLTTGCPDGAVRFERPEDGFLDARQPHPVDDVTLLQGVDTFVVAAPPGACDVECWSPCETDNNHGVHPGISPPNDIASLVDNHDGTCTITLDRPIAHGEVTTLTYASTSGLTLVTGTFTNQPADVGKDGESEAADISTLIASLNGVIVLPVERADINRDGERGPADILRVIDLLNGGGAFEPFLGVKIDSSGCP